MIQKKSSVILEFNADSNALGNNKSVRDGLSVVMRMGDTLWVANDEAISLERLTLVKGDGRVKLTQFGNHQCFSLNEYLRLPVPPEPYSVDIEEIDIEGLDYENGYLWLVGSHSRKRKAPKLQNGIKQAQKQLARVIRHGNRYLLARIPIVEHDGSYALAKATQQNGLKRTVAQLDGNSKGNDLTAALKKDRHLGSFLAIPSKDNGFDIEGLAAVGKRLFLGLRGPVLHGWAVILEVEPEVDHDDPGALKLKGIGAKNRLYRKHFLQLSGLGIRDLCVQGSDLLILAGPTMDLDGPFRVYRWRKGEKTAKGSVVPASELEKVMDLPSGQGVDYAEGIALFSPDGGSKDALLVVYDSASEKRKLDENKILADVFLLQ